jgi:tripartite-type tricarboxylate transporter receptor subunit TctC
MRSLLVLLLTVAVAMGTVFSVCTPAASAAAKSADYPEKGKMGRLIVPSGAGGGTDLAARLVAPELSKDLGVYFEVVNRPGAGWQVGLTEFVRSKPDGYTLSYTTLPTTITTYLEPVRKAIYNRSDFMPIVGQYDVPYLVVTHKNSPFKTMQDLIDAARAKPETIKSGTSGLLTGGHVSALKFAKATGAKFALVHFDGAAPQIVALVGEHVDVSLTGIAEVLPYYKSGDLRVLAIMDKRESPDFPGVKTTAALGYPVTFSIVGGICAPKGTPQEIVDILGTSLKKVVTADEHKRRLKMTGLNPTYMNAAELAKFWAEMETDIKELIRGPSKN